MVCGCCIDAVEGHADMLQTDHGSLTLTYTVPRRHAYAYDETKQGGRSMGTKFTQACMMNQSKQAAAWVQILCNPDASVHSVRCRSVKYHKTP